MRTTLAGIVYILFDLATADRTGPGFTFFIGGTLCTVGLLLMWLDYCKRRAK